MVSLGVANEKSLFFFFQMKTDWIIVYLIGLWIGIFLTITICASNLYIAEYQPKLYLQYQHQELKENVDSKILEILWCESRFDHSRSNASGAEGIAQFKPKTFDWLKEKANMPNLNINHASDQVILLDWALRNGYGHHWECY